MDIIIINSEWMGKGDAELGKTLMGAFFKKLWASPEKPDAIIFYESGVKLLTKEAGILEALQSIEESGVDIIACGTCINFYSIKEKLEVGRVSGMEEILSLMLKADKVVTI